MATQNNYVTEDTTIKGSITTASSLTIAGVVEGDVNAGGEIAVLGEAVVKGDLSGPNVRIDGRVEGRVTASGRLVIGAAGQVQGDISVRSLLIEEGGTLDGQCRMGAAAREAAIRPITGVTKAVGTTPSPAEVLRGPHAPPLRPPRGTA